uniref:Integrase catalytic domain-containing protein n=1 Tax=Tanacetum cinerariifolium TaxID=118510 RepID=A0A699HG46_TANCI|nr:hypothetical protein [Tanacetum cinerariifolium]
MEYFRGYLGSLDLGDREKEVVDKMTTLPANNSVFRGFFEKQKLTGPNFIDWYRQLMIVLSIEDKLNYLEQPIPPAPVAPEGQQELKTLFAQQAEKEFLLTMREFHSCKQKEGQSVSSYVLKMKSYIDNLEHLGHPVTLRLGVSLVLISLRKKFNGFVQNYNMHSMGKTINELHALLKLHEQTLPKTTHKLFMLYEQVRSRKGTKSTNRNPNWLLGDKIKGKGRISSLMLPSPRFSLHPKGKILLRTQSVINAGIHAIERGMSSGLRGSRKLKRGALSLYVGNGQCAAVEAIVSYYLSLPRRLVIVLNNFHYAPSMTRGIISVSRLYNDGYVNRFVDNSIQVSRNNIVYFSVVPRDDLLWHCRLGYISKKRIEKLQHVGLLNSTDFRAFEKCVPSHLRSCQDKEQDTSSLSLTNLVDHGIIAHRTPPYTPQHNGVSKRRNKTLLDMVRSMISQITLPKSFWDYALDSAVRILNMVPTKKVKKTPYEVWHGQAPKLYYLKVWGCEALVKRDTLTKPDKLEPRSIKCIFIGYLKETIGYSFYYPAKNKVSIARNAEFLKNSLITQKASGSLEDLEIIQEKDTHPSIDTSLDHEEDDLEIDKPQSDIIPIRRSTRTRHAPDYMCLYIDAEEHELRDLGELTNYKAALLDPESDKWMNAMNVEMCFAMKDLGEAVYILGITIYIDRSRRLTGLCQSAYIEKFLKRYHIENSKRGSIPMQDKLRLSKSQGASTPAKLKHMQNVPYASAVGSIMYVVRYTRLDVAFAQNITSQFQQNPCDLHWTTVKNILKYIRNTKDMFLVYEGAVDWKSANQSIFATSSAEVEYIVAFDASKEAVSVRKIIFGLGVVPTIEEPISMYYDNTRSITIANESGITKGARHFRAKLHYIREVIEYGDVKLEKVHTYDNLADPFTKALAFLKHLEHTKNIKMLSASSLMVDPGAPASGPLLTGSSLLAALSKARKDDERHQESHQNRPDQIMLQEVGAIRGTPNKLCFVFS